VARLELPSLIRIFWIADGDHDLAPRKASGVTHAEALTRAADAISAFMKESRHGAQRHGRSNQTV
jgi:predicted alpha/beta-hydrolase family hydrolase